MINILILIQNNKPIVSTASERYLLIYMIAVLIIITSLIIIFFIVFQKRKNKLLLDKIKQHQLFEEELSKTQIEIQEQTLKNIGQELHDNIGQLLSVANMQLSILTTEVSKDIKERFTETKNVVKESLSEVRELSKSLNSDVIANRGFQESLNNEVQRLNKLQILNAELSIEGDKSEFKNSKDSIILFRIIQEFLSNTIKYAGAKNLKIKLDYKGNKLVIEASDDGKGFNLKTTEKGSGLINMKSRAELINTELNLFSKPNEGVKITLVYPYRTA